MSYSGKIAKHDETILMLDENREPIIECEWNKRSACNSYYIELYKQQQKRIDKAIYFIELDMIGTALEILKGDKNEK